MKIGIYDLQEMLWQCNGALKQQIVTNNCILFWRTICIFSMLDAT